MNNNMPLGVITIISGELKGTQYFVADGQTMVIGRSKDSGIVMPHSYSHVSRHHCTIAYDGINRKFYVVDTSSTGVYNSTGHHLKSQGYVGDGTILWIGNQDCMIQLSIVTDYQVDGSPSGNYSSDRYSAGSGYANGNSNYNGSSRGRRNPSNRRRLKKENKALTFSVIMVALVIVAGISIGLVHKLNSSVNELESMAMRPTGGVMEYEQKKNAEKIDEEEKEKRDKDIEDEKEKEDENEKQDEQEKKNIARQDNSYDYYYSKLSDEEKKIYNCILKVANRPDEVDYTEVYQSDIFPDSEEFYERFDRALLSLWYDHPEIYWIYYDDMTPVYFKYAEDNSVYFYLEKTYPNYKQDSAAFDNAVDNFMSGIDLTKDDYEIALEIHDKLIDLVTYDYDEGTSGDDVLSHTAYGALVKNEKGMSNYAVCDGYSLAYVYLLAQAGIEGEVVVGDAGDRYSSGRHAWTVVCLDGEWYEVDATWNDGNNVREVWDQMSSTNKQVYEEMLSDKEFMDKYEHYLYNITTGEITDYHVDEDYYTFDASNGYALCPISDCYHRRISDPYDVYSLIMDVSPNATGTKYKYR